MSRKKKRAQRENVVVVDLKEIEWVKVLKISVPSCLVWLAYIHMLYPVQIDRGELGLLIYSVREHAMTVKALRERTALERITDKMAKAMLAPTSSPQLRSTDSRYVPNNRQSAIQKAGDFGGAG